MRRPMYRRFAVAGPMALCALAPASAFAVDYLSAEQARQTMFPRADRFESQIVRLDADQMQRLARTRGINGRSAQWVVYKAFEAGGAAGWVVVDNVVGKFELITYAVAVNRDGTIRQVEILSYRESHGGEIRLPAWRRQFVGKGPGAPLRAGQDIANISGATLSCTHVTEGIRRVLAVLEVAGLLAPASPG